MIKNIAYLFVFLVFIILGFMWLTIDKEQEVVEMNSAVSEGYIIQTIFEDELIK